MKSFVLALGLVTGVCGYCEASARPDRRTVTLKPGDNFIDATVVITDAVRYVSAPGATSRVIGARIMKASDFKKVTDPSVLVRLPKSGRGKVYVCDIRTRIEEPAVFIGGRIGELARWPNAGEWAYVSSEDVVCHGVKTGRRYEGCAFVLSDPRAKRWNFASGVRMKGYWTHDWVFSEACVGSFGTVNGTNDVVTFSYPIPYGLLSTHTLGGLAKRRYYVFGLLEELDASGEYFYDHEAGRLYVAAPEGIGRLGEIAVCDSEGPVFEVRDASGVEFVGVDVAYRKDGFLKLSGARSLLVDDCNFTCCGASYAVEASGAERCTIRNTKLSVLGAGGILMDGGDRPALWRGENLIENCKVLHFGIIKRTYAPAVRLEGVGNTVRGCELAYAPHMAVAPVCNYGLFEFNDVHDVLLETGDCGAFYTGRNWFKGQGQVFRYNHIHDLGNLGGSSCAIYFDDGQCGGEVYGNVIENVARGMLIGGGRDHIVHDNVFRNCGGGVSIDCRGLVWRQFVKGMFKLDEDAMKEVRFTETPWKAAFPRMAHYLDVPAEKFAPFGNEIYGNLFIDCSGDGKLIKFSKSFFNFGKEDDKIGPLLPRIRIENNYSASTGERKAGGPDSRAPETIAIIQEKVAWPLAHDSHVFEKLPGLMKVPFRRILAAGNE